VDRDGWIAAGARLAAGEASLLGLWGDTGRVYLASLAGGAVEVIALPCPEGGFPSIGRVHAPAIRLERTIRDLFGLEPQGAVDTRPWLDHGRWPARVPLGAAQPAEPPSPYRFLPVEGESLHQIPVGPVHAGIIEPGHFRFTANGEAVVRLEERLGYVHRGVEGLMAGADLAHGARLAGRLSGDSAVAFAWAFALAAERALGVEAPKRAAWLRALAAELERLANHFGDIGAICNDASFSMMHAHCGVLRERVLRAAQTAFDHRLMMDAVIPGGVARDLPPEAASALTALIAEIRRRFPPLVSMYDSMASLQDRTVSTGIVRPDLVRRFAPGGYVGRASGRDFDARRSLPYAPYDTLSFEVPVLEEGDVNARVWIRIREVEQSLALVEQIVGGLPEGPLSVALEPREGEGLALVEAFRGDALVWLRLAPDGRIERCHLRDASWFQWPLLEAAIEGNIVADFPLCNKSFNCSYAGHDL
jgi:Ni,Fe-hydrogenase III large subunit